MRVRGFEVVSRLDLEGCDVELPIRSTKKSAGYDFIALQDEDIEPMLVEYIKSIIEGIVTSIASLLNKKEDDKENKSRVVPHMVRLGVKSYMGDDEVLYLYNRSSNPKKLGLVVANGVGVVDSDYYGNPDNDGEIGILFYNLFPVPVHIKKGDKVCQGVFNKFLKADGDMTSSERLSGFGSTGK